MVWMADRKWKETKQQPSMLPGPAVPGCSLVSFHFLWAILCPQAVLISDEKFCSLPFAVLPEDPLRQRRALFVLRHGRVPAAAVAAAPGGGPPHQVRGDSTVLRDKYNGYWTKRLKMTFL